MVITGGDAFSNIGGKYLILYSVGKVGWYFERINYLNSIFHERVERNPLVAEGL